MNNKPIDERIEWLFNINKEHSAEFIRTRFLRKIYRVNHPTEICAFKCMDGRIHIPVVTNTPIGVIRPYRNIGGFFDLGWPLLGEDLIAWVDYAISKGRKSLILVTYHFSQGDQKRGCAGFDYDQEASFDFTVNFYKQVNRLFGANNQVIFPIVVGLDTDTDALIFHPQNPAKKEGVFSCKAETSDKSDYLLDVINNLYPDMDAQVRADLLPLIQGNIAHIKEIKEQKRDLIEMRHCEWILGIGRGFDWMHVPNTALIVGPYSPDLSDPIIKAVGIIKNNMEAGAIPNDGFLVLLSAPFREHGVDENRAREKALFFKEYVTKIIEKNYPELLPKAKFIAVTIDDHTRRANIVE